MGAGVGHRFKKKLKQSFKCLLFSKVFSQAITAVAGVPYIYVFNLRCHVHVKITPKCSGTPALQLTWHHFLRMLLSASINQDAVLCTG